MEIFPAYKAPQSYIIAIIFALVGILLLGTLVIVSLPLLLFAALLVGFRRGYLVDTDQASFSSYRSLFGVRKTYNHRALADLEYISLVRIKTSQTMWVESIQTSVSDVQCKLNFIKGKRNLIPIAVGEKDKLMKKAVRIANCADLKIFDMTTANKEWIEPSKESREEK